MDLENLVLYVAFTMGKASSLDLSADFCKSAFHGGLVSHMQDVLTSTGTSIYSIYLFVCLFVHLSAYLSIYLSVYLSI